MPRWLVALGLHCESQRTYDSQLGDGTGVLGYASHAEDTFSPKATIQWQIM